MIVALPMRCCVGLILCIFGLAGCGKSQKIDGVVTDAFGMPLKDVIVAIEKSSYSAVTDHTGAYALDYAPGTFAVNFSKPGFLSQKLELNLSQKTNFHAERIGLLPEVSLPGVYLLDVDQKQLAKMAANTKPFVSQASTGTFAGNISFGVFCSSETCGALDSRPGVLASGLTKFIIGGEKYRLHMVRQFSGHFYSAQRFMSNEKVLWQRTPKLTSKPLDVEGRMIVEVDLLPGAYAWVPYKSTLAGDRPNTDQAAYSFYVVNDGSRIDPYIKMFDLGKELNKSISAILPDSSSASDWVEVDISKASAKRAMKYYYKKDSIRRSGQVVSLVSFAIFSKDPDTYNFSQGIFSQINLEAGRLYSIVFQCGAQSKLTYEKAISFASQTWGLDLKYADSGSPIDILPNSADEVLSRFACNS